MSPRKTQNLWNTSTNSIHYETQIYFASQNTKSWSPMKQNMTSPKYTTSWYELPIANQGEKNETRN